MVYCTCFALDEKTKWQLSWLWIHYEQHCHQHQSNYHINPPVHQNELAVAASEDWVLLPSFYLLQVGLTVWIRLLGIYIFWCPLSGRTGQERLRYKLNWQSLLKGSFCNSCKSNACKLFQCMCPFQAADFLGSLVSGVSHQLTRAALFLLWLKWSLDQFGLFN